MMRVVSVLMCVACWSVGGVHGGPNDQVVANPQEPSPSFSYSSDRYRDPFVASTVIPTPVDSAEQGRDVSPQTVKVVGTMSSAQGRWAVLEFEGGEQLIVMQGQVISAYSRVVKRITERGVTLLSIGETATSQTEKTYWLDEELQIGESRSGGNSEHSDG